MFGLLLRKGCEAFVIPYEISGTVPLFGDVRPGVDLEDSVHGVGLFPTVCLAVGISVSVVALCETTG